MGRPGQRAESGLAALALALVWAGSAGADRSGPPDSRPPEVAARDAADVVVVIDVQEKLMDKVERTQLVLRATVRLLQLADIFRVPVLLTEQYPDCLLYTSPSPRDGATSRMPSSA